MKFKSPYKDEVAELLGTKDKALQVERIKQVASAPVVELVVRLDGRTNQVSFSVWGGQLPPAVAYQMLDACRDLIRRDELAAVIQRENGHVAPPAIVDARAAPEPEPET